MPPHLPRECAFDLARKPRLDSLWVNLLKSGGQHSGHIHPHSISRALSTSKRRRGSGAIRFEDPRLPLMMAAPPRATMRPRSCGTFVAVAPRPGCC